LNRKTAKTFRAVKGSASGSKNLEELARETAEMMGMGSKLLSIQEMHNLSQGFNVVLAIALLRCFCVMDFSMWLMRKMIGCSVK
jgi:hypothetical protein